MSDLLAAALDYAARGLPVFPCMPRGKTPAVARGFHSATTNPATIRRYWTDPDRNIGDSDRHATPASGCSTSTATRARRACARSRRSTEPFRKRVSWSLPAVAMCGLHIRDPSRRRRQDRSRHRYARRWRLRHRAAVHPSKQATATPSSAIPGHDLQPAPAWLIDRRPHQAECSYHRARRGDDPPAPCRAGAYGHAALRAEIAALAATPPGRRNHALNRAAFNLFQLVAGGELAEAEVIAALQGACVANGLANDDGWQSVHATIRSGRGAGMQHPRSRGAP